MKDKEIIHFQVEVPLDVWNRFKDKIPRTETLHDAIVKIIKDISDGKIIYEIIKR